MMTTTAVYQLPGADGSSGDCLSTNGAAVLSWVSCSGGGSSPPFVDTTNIIKGSSDATKLLRFEVDGLTTATTRTWTAQDANITVAGIDLAQTWTATQTMRDIKPSVDDTYKLGEDATPLRWNEINVNRINGICTVAFTCSGSNNYTNTRKLNLYDTNGSIGGGFWDIRTNAASPVTSYLEMRDQAGTAFLTLTRQASSVTVNNATMDGNILPSSDATYTLGTSTTRWGASEASQWIARSASGGNRLCRISGGSVECFDASSNSTFSAASLTGQITSKALAGGGTLCLQTDNSGNIGATSAACGLGTVTSVTGTSPISSSGGATPAISCSTCVTTAGGQTISGTTTISTLIVATAVDSALTPSSDAFYALGTSTVRWGASEASQWIARSSSGSNRRCRISGGSIDCYDGSSNNTFSANSLTGQLTSAVLAGSGTRCLQSDNSGNVGLASAGCGLGTVTSIATSGPISGGTITGTGTISCPTCVTSVTGASPIVSSGGTTPSISCSTCVTTAGGQTISGTTTVSTLSVSTAISGTYNLSGSETVTGNWYARSFSGSGVSCSGVGDGWLGWDYTNQYLIMCAGGNRYRVNLAAY
jgi:predicted DNA-binding transcriptional regulator AlpA